MRPLRCFQCLAATAFLAVTGASHADEPVRPPETRPDEFPQPAARGRIALSGVAVTAGFYGAAVGASYAWPSAPGADELRIPVAGPWMALADTGCPDHDPDCNKFIVVLRAALTTLDGIAQAGGLGIALESAFMPTRPPRRGRSAQRPVEPRIRPVPFTTGRGGVGIGFIGHF